MDPLSHAPPNESSADLIIRDGHHEWLLYHEIALGTIYQGIWYRDRGHHQQFLKKRYPGSHPRPRGWTYIPLWMPAATIGEFVAIANGNGIPIPVSIMLQNWAKEIRKRIEYGQFRGVGQ